MLSTIGAEAHVGSATENIALSSMRAVAEPMTVAQAMAQAERTTDPAEAPMAMKAKAWPLARRQWG